MCVCVCGQREEMGALNRRHRVTTTVYVETSLDFYSSYFVFRKNVFCNICVLKRERWEVIN